MITYGTGTYAGVLTVITGDISEVQGIVQAGLTAQGYTSTRAGNLDDITAIKAKTDNLPAQPASKSDISVVNEGVKKASLLVPHTTNLT
jgi:hypothetical protein